MRVRDRLERASEPNGSQAKMFFCAKKRKEGYLRFLNIIMFCGVVQMHCYPLSISSPASCRLWLLRGDSFGFLVGCRVFCYFKPNLL